MTASDTTFPVESFKDAATFLRRPFTSAAVRFKVQAAFPKNNPDSALIVAYIDARLAVERLNLVCPHLWFDEYQHDGNLLICKLTIDDISRQDVGEGVGKALYSDALKRAAVKFGVGVSLYAIPKTILRISDGHLKPAKDTLALTPNGETHVRRTYDAWLDLRGRQAFGEPLDHGDSDDAQGDTEVGDEPTTEADALASSDDITTMQHAADGLRTDQVKLALAACGIAGVTGYNRVPAASVTDLCNALAAMERKS